ncbi:MAG: hypothetical protein AAFW98_10390 [Pseudomonadota bacterium]
MSVIVAMMFAVVIAFAPFAGTGADANPVGEGVAQTVAFAAGQTASLQGAAPTPPCPVCPSGVNCPASACRGLATDAASVAAGEGYSLQNPQPADDPSAGGWQDGIDPPPPKRS